jgi:hypothetical protein
VVDRRSDHKRRGSNAICRTSPEARGKDDEGRRQAESYSRSFQTPNKRHADCIVAAAQKQKYEALGIRSAQSEGESPTLDDGFEQSTLCILFEAAELPADGLHASRHQRS